MDEELKARLLKPRLPEAEVELDGIGTVRVRGLSNFEATVVQETSVLAAKQRKMLNFGMLDPQLSEAEAGRWMKASPAGEIEKVTARIAQLSGMTDDAAKQAVKTFRGEPGPGVPPLSGGEAGDDGGPDVGGDV